MGPFTGQGPADGEPETVPGYRNLRLLGGGGSSAVFRAHQEAFDREVALKVLTVPLDERTRQRFLREVTTTAKLTGHPNVVALLDAGTTRSGRLYLTTDLYEHGSLTDRLDAEGPLPAVEVAWIGAKIADALAEAHRLGIVHRDVKPSNILVSRFGEPALADFGVACLVDGQASMTVLGTFTPSHAAPEVVNGDPPNPSSDIYALGSTMYQLLVGRPAFGREGEPVVAIMRRILTEQPAEPVCPDLPSLPSVVMRAMAKRPQDRYPNAAAFASALRDLMAGAGLAQPSVTMPGRVPRRPDEVPRPTTPARQDDRVTVPGQAGVPPAAQSRRRGVAVLAVVAVVLALAGLVAGVGWWRSTHHTVQPGAQGERSNQPEHGVLSDVSPIATATASSSAADRTPRSPGPPRTRRPAPPAESRPTATTGPSTPPSTTGPSEQPRSVCLSDGCAAKATFTAHGDHLYVCDNASDGHSAVAWYRRSDVPAQNNEAWDPNGTGTCIDHNMNMPQGTTITFKVCLGEYGSRELLTCSDTITDTA